MVDVGSSDDVIYGLSDLADYLESKGFQPNFYDNVERDIVDKTIKDQQEWMINFVRNDIGIKQTYDMIEDTFKTKLEREKSNKAYAETSIEELLDEVKAGINKEVDDQLDNEDFELDVDEDE